MGDKCDTCKPGFFGQQCEVCQCHQEGILNNYCNVENGMCTCKSMFMGDSCDTCKPGFDPTHDPACGACQSEFYGYENCRACECNIYGRVDNNCDLETGKCNCMDNFMGDKCETCQPGFFGQQCEECQCNVEGSLNTECNLEGKCNCKDNFMGDKCDTCKPGFFGQQCEECQCNLAGSLAESTECNLEGKCNCKDTFMGDKCDTCKPGFFGQECEDCGCDETASLNKECDSNGKCSCNQNVKGDKCSECEEDKKGHPLCHVTGCKTRNGKDCIFPFEYKGKNYTQCTTDKKKRKWIPFCATAVKSGKMSNKGQCLKDKSCQVCECNIHGRVDNNCDMDSGKCTCKSNYKGDKCDTCETGFFGQQCEACNCNDGGSLNTECNLENGKCNCKANFMGDKCETDCGKSCNSEGTSSCDPGVCNCNELYDGDLCGTKYTKIEFKECKETGAAMTFADAKVACTGDATCGYIKAVGCQQLLQTMRFHTCNTDAPTDHVLPDGGPSNCVYQKSTIWFMNIIYLIFL